MRFVARVAGISKQILAAWLTISQRSELSSIYNLNNVNDVWSGEDERFHPLIEATSAALFVLQSGRIVYINPAARILTERTARNLIGSRFSRLFHPSFRSMRGASDPMWLDLRLEPLMYRGSPATLATATDITRLKQSDLTRIEAEVQLKLVQRAGRTVSWDWDASTDELTVYGMTEKIIADGARVLATTARAFFDLLDSDNVIALKQAIRTSLSERQPLFIEVSLRTPEGSAKRIVLRGQPVANPSGSRGHIVGVATDITELHRVEKALIEEQRQNLQMLASISDGVVRVNLEGRIEDMSTPAEKLVDKKLNQVRGIRFDEVIKLVDEQTGNVLPDPIRASFESPDHIAQPQTAEVVREDGEATPIRFHTAILRDRNADSIGAILVLKDLMEEKRVERSMVYLATHDPLTDLLNRSEFERMLSQSMSTTRSGSRRDALLYMDLDDFDLVNTTFGYPAGDRMLRQFSSFLKTRFRETDLLGRIGGDKFGVLLENCAPWRARELIEKVYQDIRTFRFEWEGTSLPVGLSTGMTALEPSQTNPERALAAAEAACNLAKQKGGNSFFEYEATKVAASDRSSQVEMLHQIQDALDSDSFRLFAQAIVPLQTSDDSPAIYEMLVRMNDRAGNTVLPNAFIPVAERHRIITAVDRWVVNRALEVIAERSLDTRLDPTLFAINISGQSLGDDRFLEFILNQLAYRGVDPSRICFEITETATIESFDRADRFISVLKGRGCRFVLDDFGSGLSSFAYLRKFPVDYIKIDGQFVLDLSTDPTHRALVEAINHVGHVMHIKTIAESVEHPSCVEILRQMKVDYAQGHHFSIPTPVEQAILDSDSVGPDVGTRSKTA
ncbi:MAG: EAL domain-containing protein [Acidobacteriota bacterium]